VIEKITHNQEILAIIIRHDYSEKGINFFTPPGFSQQLGFMKHPKGYVIQPHIHNQVSRDVSFTQEVLFIRKGKVQMSLFTNQKNFFQNIILKKGDCVLLASGGHAFAMLEESEIIEVKTGPHVGEIDKTRFEIS
jgi:hypothetical protein